MLKPILFLGFALFASTPCWADWASGGGELIQDAENPWFVQNTRVVRYCTLYDFDQYSQTAEITQQALDDAVAFWKEEFRHGQTIFEPRILVATQDFVKAPCPNGREDVDIVFQFGFLYEEQLTFVKDPSRYAALAIRTDYDTVNLRGKGFVYVAADKGPYRFRGEETVESPWTYGDAGLLYWTLVHELGHVFGLSHTKQRGGDLNVMASDFIETITSRGSASLFTRDLNVNPIFRVRAESGDIAEMWCSSRPGLDALKEFFGIDQAWPCFGTKLVADGLEIYASDGYSTDEILVGTARVNRHDGQEQSFTLVDNAIHFWLPPDQTMFPPNSRVFTPAYYIEDAVATYTNVAGTIRRQLSYSLDPRRTLPTGDDLKIGGVLHERLYINLKEGI